jgi:hypothetical protein
MTHQRIVLCLLSIGLALGPLAYFLAHSFQIDSAPEFVYYRIGDALSLLGGEAEYVRPIQGIPNAILSKLAVWILGDQVVTREGSRAYGILFSLMLGAPVVAAIGYAWRGVPVSVALAQLLVLALPFWFGSASHGLMIAPDYWIAELAYVGITLPILYALSKWPADRAYVVAGVWIGVGVSIKITLFPVAFLFIVFLEQWKRERITAMLGAALFTFIALDLVYMADVVQTVKLLRTQAIFFIRPNSSAYYPDFLSAFLARPIVPMLTAVFLILCAVRRNAVTLALLGWVAVYLYLIARRPHDTSMASFAISLGFMAAIVALQFERRALILSALVIVAFVGSMFGPFNELQNTFAKPRNKNAENVARADAFFNPPGAVWFIPSNDWNSTYSPQGFAVQGGLALRPRERREIFRRLFSGADLALNLGEASEQFRGGAAIYWTRPIDSDPTALFKALEGARITEQRGELRGVGWIFGKAKAQAR